VAEPLEQGIGSADPCPSGAGKEVAAWNAPRMGTLIFTHMPNVGRSQGAPSDMQRHQGRALLSVAPTGLESFCTSGDAPVRNRRVFGPGRSAC
jgi:hypothetical protein